MSVWPTMLTPFNAEGDIDVDGLGRLVEWYLDRGVDGLFAVCLSSEMFHLRPEERRTIARLVVETVAGRVPVAAGALAGGGSTPMAGDGSTPMAGDGSTALAGDGSTATAGDGSTAADTPALADEVRALRDAGAAVVVLLTNRLAAPEESDDVWRSRAERLLDTVPDIPLGLYECPSPYRRSVSTDLLAWCARTGRFVFFKDTCCDVARLRERLDVLRGTALRLYNANTETLLASLHAGAAGFSGIMANFHPELYVWLTRHWSDEPERAERLHRWLTQADAIGSVGYPGSAKRLLRYRGLDLPPYCRCMAVDESTDGLRDLNERLRPPFGVD